jgi:ankyrin repeat protein
VIAPDDPRAVALVALLDTGDVAGLEALLAAHPDLVTERFGDEDESRTVLHLATDWPGNRPAVGHSIAVLVAAGAPVDGRFVGHHRETPLHWAASADDIEAIDALLDAGADIEADGGVLTDGPPLDDAVVFAQWKAARRLVERGATMTIWHAAALGELMTLDVLSHDADTDQDDLDNACWHACRAGQLLATQSLVRRGADLDRQGHLDQTAREAGCASANAELVAWLRAAD